MEIILKYFPGLNTRQIGQLSMLRELYSDWNDKINVISRKDLDNLYERHILHSLAIAKVIHFLPGARVLDVGTGGGFPGIPLAIFFPETDFVLCDSIGKKIKVVTEVSSSLHLKNVLAINARAETIPGPFDFVVSRAVAPLSELYNWVKKGFRTSSKHAMPNGLICLKGGDLIEEIGEMHTHVKTYPITEWFPEPFFETKKVVYVAAR